MKDKRGGKSIRSKIVFGYARIYILISFLFFIIIVATTYLTGFFVAQNYIAGDMMNVLDKLPKYEDTSDDELYEFVNAAMPSYVVRYDFTYNKERLNPNEALYNYFISPEASPAPVHESVEQEDAQDYAAQDLTAGYVTIHSLNMYMGPGNQYDILFSLDYGTKVEVVEEGEDWNKIIYENNVAYVESRYVMIGDVTPPPYDKYWGNVEEHLFSKSGTESYTTNSYDGEQAYNPFYNLIEINRVYKSSNKSWIIEDTQENLFFREYYRIYAVVDVSKIIDESTMYTMFAFAGLALLIFFIIGFLIVTLYGTFKTRKYLKPISDITKMASELQPNSTQRINVNTAQYELKELVITINNMLDRLNAAHVKRKKFVSDVSHELRTPISVVAGYANMLKRWAKDDEEVFDESVNAIIGESANMKYLVENLLFLARSDNEQNIYEMEPFDISNLIESICKDAKMVDKGKHEIICDIEQGVIINGDRNRLKQAVREFLQNAIKYTPPTGEIKMSLQKNDGKGIISIKDTGIGISKKDMGHIFTRFYRGDVSRNRDNGGYGLGLAICREIISAHDGKITFKSKESAGTSATVTLPLA